MHTCHYLAKNKKTKTEHTITPEDSNRFKPPSNPRPHLGDLETCAHTRLLQLMLTTQSKRSQFEKIYLNIIIHPFYTLKRVGYTKKRREKTPPPGTTRSSKRVVRKSMPVVSVVAAVLQKIGEVPLS